MSVLEHMFYLCTNGTTPVIFLNVWHVLKHTTLVTFDSSNFSSTRIVLVALQCVHHIDWEAISNTKQHAWSQLSFYLFRNSTGVSAEACKTIGGETCIVEMYPEVKLEACISEQRYNDSSVKKGLRESMMSKT